MIRLETVAVLTIWLHDDDDNDDNDKAVAHDLLAASKWTSTLSAGQLQRARTTTIVRELGPGNYACHKGDPSNEWIGVVDGLIKMANLSETGRSVTFATFPANCWFGEGSILKQEPRKYDVVALRDCRVALMPTVTFFWLLDTSI